MEPSNNLDNTRIETSIFDDVKLRDEEKYKKVIKNARSCLFVIAAFQLVYAIIVTCVNGDQTIRIVTIVFGVCLAGIFTGLGFYCEKKPFIALVTGLCIYSILLIIDIYADPASIAKGLFIKGVIMTWLINGIMKAKSLDDIHKLNK